MPAPTLEERLQRKAEGEAAAKERADARAEWIADNPEAYAAEQEALEANRKAIKDAQGT
ncbi:MAG: hypothetical protein KJO40_18275 [Deltaproteobacteria bacterium]|nr:hypothetical protein [Deltaproteobacteria bacterium]